jgi:hypothetical protein
MIRFVVGMLLMASTGFAAEADHYQMVEFRWGNQIMESTLTIQSNGQFETSYHSTMRPTPDDTTSAKGNLSGNELKSLTEAIARLSSKSDEIAGGQAKDGQKYGFLYARKSGNDNLLTVQSFQPQWLPDQQRFSNDASHILNQSESRCYILRKVKSLLFVVRDTMPEINCK